MCQVIGGDKMATFQSVKMLIKAHLENDTTTFRRVALQIAAKESNAGHTKISKEIKELIENTPSRVGQSAGAIISSKRKANVNVEQLLTSNYPTDNLKDMVLNTKTKDELVRLLLEWRQRRNLESYGLNCRKKILLTGPPGCGKTMSASVIAGELTLPLFVVKLEGLISRYLGETSIHLKNIFDMMESTPGVYLFDEFDSIGSTRGDSKEVGEIRRILSSFLIMLEEFNGDSIIVAATNYENNLDWALFRRFDSVIKYTKPTKEECIGLIKLKIRNFEVEKIDWNNIVTYAEGLSYAEITKATMEAIKTTILNNNNVLTEQLLALALRQRKNMYTIKDI